MNELSFSDLRRVVIGTLERAADTLRRLPIPQHGRPAPAQSSWPDTPGSADGAPVPARARAIDELEQVLPWLVCLDNGERCLVWARAAGVPWARLARETGMKVGRLRHRWNVAIDRVVAHAVRDGLVATPRRSRRGVHRIAADRSHANRVK